MKSFRDAVLHYLDEGFGNALWIIPLNKMKSEVGSVPRNSSISPRRMTWRAWSMCSTLDGGVCALKVIGQESFRLGTLRPGSIGITKSAILAPRVVVVQRKPQGLVHRHLHHAQYPTAISATRRSCGSSGGWRNVFSNHLACSSFRKHIAGDERGA